MYTYEFTAFSEASLLAQGGNGSNIDCGDTFTMPGVADVCLTVQDNDSKLSGDSCYNENADDYYGQTASITQNGQHIGNGGQIYAESYHWVYDQHGNWYVMIEVEQEGDGQDFFTFYTGGGYSVPPAGAQLTVHSTCNVTSEWIDFNCLDAGEKFEPDPWSFDPDTCTYTIEAEALDLHGFKVVDGAHASGGELVKIEGCDGKLSTDFGGETGIYNMTICVQDECDGASMLKVYVNGEFQQTIRLDANSDGWGSDDGGFSAVTLNGLEIAEGDHVEIRAWADGGEWVRIDALKFEQVKFMECDDPDAVLIDFESFGTGDVLTNQIPGVTISAMGGAHEAMIFDSQNPTGGDHDLETQVAQLGNVLIVSEDGDSSDPDDAIGGKITFEFDAPSEVFDLKVIDTEEGGTITLTLEDGSTQTFDIPNLVNGGVGQVVMGVENVVRMDVQLDGSGAIDDLCYVPGVVAPPPGALEGRYFCDLDGDGIDSRPVNEPAVEGAVVILLEADGVTRATDNDGNLVQAVTTDSNGDYRFDNLAARSYVVQFAAAEAGKEFVAANQGDNPADDSDVTTILSDGTGLTAAVEVFSGQTTSNVDAGITDINDAPIAVDDAGAVCVGQTTVVDLLAGDTDPEGDTLSVTQISDADETAGVGGTITLASGATATLNADGTVNIDATNALPDLLIGDMAADEFEYTLSDGELTDTGAVDLTLKGALNTVDTISADLTEAGCVSFTLSESLVVGDGLYTMNVVDVEFGDTRLGEVLSSIGTFDLAFCASFLTPIETDPVVNEFTISVLSEASYTAAIQGAVQPPVPDIGFNPENTDNVSWLLNEADTLLTQGYTENDMQRAIWQLLDGGDDNAFTTPGLEGFFDARPQFGREIEAQELVDLALANDGFVAESGDIVTLMLDPKVDGVQPFIVGVEFDLLAEVCSCDDMII